MASKKKGKVSGPALLLSVLGPRAARPGRHLLHRRGRGEGQALRRRQPPQGARDRRGAGRHPDRDALLHRRRRRPPPQGDARDRRRPDRGRRSGTGPGRARRGLGAGPRLAAPAADPGPPGLHRQGRGGHRRFQPGRRPRASPTAPPPSSPRSTPSSTRSSTISSRSRRSSCSSRAPSGRPSAATSTCRGPSSPTIPSSRDNPERRDEAPPGRHRRPSQRRQVDPVQPPPGPAEGPRPPPTRA